MPKKDIVEIKDLALFQKRLELRMEELDNLKKQTLANLLGIDKQLLNHYIQKGRIPVETFKKIVFYLSCTEGYLLEQTDNSTIDIKDGKERQMLVQFQIADIFQTKALQLLKDRTFEMHQIISFLEVATPKEISQLLRFVSSFENMEYCSFTAEAASNFYYHVFNEAFVDALAYEHTLKEKKNLTNKQKKAATFSRFKRRIKENCIRFIKAKSEN